MVGDDGTDEDEVDEEESAAKNPVTPAGPAVTAGNKERRKPFFRRVSHSLPILPLYLSVCLPAYLLFCLHLSFCVRVSVWGCRS